MELALFAGYMGERGGEKETTAKMEAGLTLFLGCTGERGGKRRPLWGGGLNR